MPELGEGGGSATHMHGISLALNLDLAHVSVSKLLKILLHLKIYLQSFKVGNVGKTKM